MYEQTAKADSGEKKVFGLSRFAQIITGSILVVMLVGSFLFTSGSFIIYAGVIALLVILAIIQNPTASLLAYVVINVVITIHGKDHEGFSAFDLLFGGMLIIILVYWIIRLRIIESSSLSTSVGQLLLMLFGIWSIIATSMGFVNDHFNFFNALRELLNISPLLLLPVIYSRFVPYSSPQEKWIALSVFFSGIFLVIWNSLRMRSNIVHAFYLYAIGREGLDELLALLIAVIAVSMLMSVRSKWKSIFWIYILLLGGVGVIICFSRALYIELFLCICFTVWLGTREERLRGIRYLSITSTIGFFLCVPIYLYSRVFRLLVLRYGLRFLSSQHLGTDLSLVNRYIEWKYEWFDILKSPILGHGFGSTFRMFDLILHFHTWMSFSHNGYLYIIFKTGFIGGILFFAAYLAFLIKGFRLLRASRTIPRIQLLLRPAVIFLAGFLVHCYTAPVLDSKTDLIWVGLMWGYILTIEQYLKKNSIIPILNEAMPSPL